MKRIFFLFLILLFFGEAAGAKKTASYQTGRVVSVYDDTIDMGLLFPVHLFSVLKITGNGSTYVISTEKPSDQIEWAIGDSVDFRVQGNRALLKRPNGRDLKARLMRVYGRAEAVPPPVTYSPPLRYPVTSSGKVAKTLSLGMEFLRSGDVCFAVFAYVEAGDFFNGLRSHKSADGIVFRRHSQIVTSFPDKLTAHVFAVLDQCVRGRRTSDAADNPQSFHLDEKFISSLTFDGVWKQEFEEKPVEFGPAEEGRIKSPTVIPSNGEWWRCDF
jgi:hypothetical protein